MRRASMKSKREATRLLEKRFGWLFRLLDGLGKNTEALIQNAGLN